MQQWSSQIAVLGTSVARRTLMGTHMVAGAIAMLLAPLQLFERPRQWCAALAHRWSGRAIILLAVTISIAGTAYIIAYGSVGGLPMSVGFGINGVLLLIAALCTLYTSICLGRSSTTLRNSEGTAVAYVHHHNGPRTFWSTEDPLYCQATSTSRTTDSSPPLLESASSNNDTGVFIAQRTQQIYKRWHRRSAFVLFGLIYSSVYYRVLYSIARLVAGYEPPPAAHPEWYARPLDRSFQYLFFIIPLLFAGAAEAVVHIDRNWLHVSALTGTLFVQIVSLVAMFAGSGGGTVSRRMNGGI